MDAASSKLWTITRISEHLGVPRHRVEYIVAAREIQPTERAGNARVFTDEQVQLIAAALTRQGEWLPGGVE
ncbi:MAG: hypothetical protein R3B57_10045 [Phycisphaerales bacterium]